MIFRAAVQRTNFFLSLSITLYCLPLMLVNKVDQSVLFNVIDIINQCMSIDQSINQSIN